MEMNDMKGVRPITPVYIAQWLQRYGVILTILIGIGSGMWRLSIVATQQVDKLNYVIQSNADRDKVTADLLEQSRANARNIDQIMFRLQITPAPVKGYYTWPSQDPQGSAGQAGTKNKHSLLDPFVLPYNTARKQPPDFMAGGVLNPDQK
jgi:hypothetical protein